MTDEAAWTIHMSRGGAVSLTVRLPDSCAKSQITEALADALDAMQNLAKEIESADPGHTDKS